MDSQTVFNVIAEGHLMAGMRGGFSPQSAVETARTLYKEGIRVFEYTMNSPQPFESMQAIKQSFGDDACVGMGTVLTVEAAQQAVAAGADFVVSPAFQPEVVRVVLDAGVLMAPGVTTPSEAVAAWAMGAPLLKLFPIGTLGVDYFKAMFGPLKHMKFQINGGMNAENVPLFLNAGAVSCGMAGWLTGDGSMGQDAIRNRARQLKRAIDAAYGVPRTV